MRFVIGTRGSRLALVQAEHVKNRMEEAYPEHTFELKIIKTKGDLIQDRPLNQIGDKGLFVKEIEEQILNGQVHIGVHSMKDMPTTLPQGLIFTKSWKREDPRDVLILRKKKSLAELPKGAVIGTGSKRRAIQLLKLRPDLQIVDIRGNVDTRIRKMQEQKLDGIVLAAAGIHRLGMQEVITRYLEPTEMLCAPAQGILALEIREDQQELLEMLNALSDEETDAAAVAERGFLQMIGGDCHVPIGAFYAQTENGGELRCMFGNEDGSRIAYAAVCGAEPEELAREAVKEIHAQLAGKVYLVGGGPGDPGLITVKGLEAIKKADCIVYDRLAAPELLEEAKAGCEKIYVGKEDRHHTLKQEEINQLLVRKAREYRNVVRLKGGDVYVFGRGGEEGLYLKERGIAFEVIPGISSSLAGLAYAGIPITHRGVAGGFHVVTAHSQKDELADIDFNAMAEGKDTCVFLMGLSKVSEIADGLLNAGKSPETMAAVISCATTGKQKTVTAKLAEIADQVRKSEIGSPALIVVGDVVNLRDELNFFEEKPLFGKHYLVPKIGKKVSALTEKLEAAGAPVTEVQVGNIETVHQEFCKEELSKVNWLVFTSRNGVESFFKNLYGQNMDIRALASAKAAAIGSQTAKALERYGIKADFVPEKFHSEALKKGLKEQIKQGDIVWYLKAADVEEDWETELEGCCRFEKLAVYRNREVEPEVSEEAVRRCDGIFFTCASSVERFFAKIQKEEMPEDCRIYSIGPKCSAALQRLGIKDICEAGQCTYDAMVEHALSVSCRKL